MKFMFAAAMVLSVAAVGATAHAQSATQFYACAMESGDFWDARFGPGDECEVDSRTGYIEYGDATIACLISNPQLRVATLGISAEEADRGSREPIAFTFEDPDDDRLFRGVCRLITAE